MDEIADTPQLILEMQKVQKLREFEDFLQLATMFFKSIGSLPYSRLSILNVKHTLSSEFVFYVCIINLNLNLAADFGYAVWAFQTDGRFIEAVTAMSYVSFVVSAEVKVLCIWWQRKVLIAMMQQLYERFPKVRSLQNQYNLEHYLKLCRYITTGFSTLYMVLIVFYSFFGVLQYFIIECWLGWRVVGLNVPYLQLLPWNYQDNWSFYAVYASQLLGGFVAAAQIVASDLLLCAVSIQLIMHFDFISKSLTNYQVEDMPNTAKDIEYARQIIIYHEQLLRLSDDLNVVFGLPLLLNFMISSCIICFLAFLITAGVPGDVLLKLMLYLFCSLSQVYMICYLGQQLTDASLGVFHAVFNQDWLNADQKYKRILLLIGERSSRTFRLKATIFVKVTAETLTLIIQMSYKFFTLLRAMYGN